MSKIIKVLATEELLKIYFFKLYSRKNEISNLIFDEQKIHSFIMAHPTNDIESRKLFNCISIDIRSGVESFEVHIPQFFYYFIDHGILDGTIEEHPFLYTKIISLDNFSFYEADCCINGIATDLLDKNGEILKTIGPNLYDNGFCKISIFSHKSKLILITYSDENNYDCCDLYTYNDGRLQEVDEIDNKYQVLEIIINKRIPEILSKASDELCNDKEVVLAAVANDGNALKYASEELKNNKGIVLAAVKNNGFALLYASKELKNNKEFVLFAVITNGCALLYASEEFKNNKEVVLAAVANDGTALKYASEELKNNKEIVLTAVNNRKEAIRYSSVDIKSDTEFLNNNSIDNSYLDSSIEDDDIIDDLPF